VEYHVTSVAIHKSERILKEIIQEFSIQNAYAKSFDFNVISACLGIQKEAKVVGMLFREYAPQPIQSPDTPIKIRLAEASDEMKIREIDDGLFEADEEMAPVIQNQNMFIFENESEIVGCGIFQRIIPGRPEFDIGMLVNPKYRRQGYGTYIISYLTQYCLNQGWRPACGCAIENIGSQQCLQKAGFIGRFRMIEFRF